MSFIQVKELRQAGKLDEAYQVALQYLAEKKPASEAYHPIFAQLFENQPDLIWAKRAMAWVLYEYLKQSEIQENHEAFFKYLTELVQLELPSSEVMVFDAIAWQIGKLVFELQKQEKIEYQKIDILFEVIQKFHFTKPSPAYSFLYKAFHKGHQGWSNYLEFANWWNFEYFEAADYLEEELPKNGKKVMALVEQAYIAYAKKLLEKAAEGLDREKIAVFLPMLDTLIEKYPRYRYLPYFKAKLLLAIGDPEDAFSAFLPFAKAKKNEFWVWDVMAEMFSNNHDKQIACYCKALSCGTSEEFLIKVRTKLAALLIETEKYNEAKTEITFVLNINEQQGWKVSRQVSQWLNSTWYKEADVQKDNRILYRMHAPLAEQLLFANLPEEIAVVEFVNRDKKMLNFIINLKRYGFLKYDGFFKEVNIGDIIAVRLDSRSSDGYYAALTLQQTDKKPDNSVLKNFEGRLDIRNDNPFGFVENIMVDSKLIQEYRLNNGDFIKGTAIASFNKKKQEWGWKVVSLTM